MSHEDYTVAWICALPLEAAAAKAMLDNIHPQLSQPAGDDNAYILGEISGHNIVVACLPSGVYGIASAATVAAHRRISFPSIRFGLIVGIGGGVPSTKNDIRLGDVVVSKPAGVFGGVVQYDYGKTVASGVFQQTGMMNQPPQVLLSAIARLRADDIMGQNQSIVDMISNVLDANVEMKAPCSRPTNEQDTLFNSAYDHPQHEDTCINCDKRHLIHRDPRTSDEPRIHYGLIASGNQVMKHGKTRDQLGEKHGMLCFEMEAAGLMIQLPCLVIRGICDYSDSHKNKQWQGYAALTAAAYAKMLLSVVSVNRFRKSQISQTGCWMVPFKRNPRFLGRHNELVELEQKILNNNDQVRKMAITGLGGVGKTQIALQVAYQVKDRKPECSIFWIPSTSIEMIEQAYMSIGKHLGLQGVTPAEIKMRLLIVDNVDDMNIWLMSDGSSPALDTYLPESKYGFVLFTSRNRQLATKLVGPDIINISITQAASYINETEISVANYLSLLQSQENVMVELLSQDFEDEWRYAGFNNSVATTWLISFKQIQRLNPVASDYLLFMSCIDPRDIPLSLLPPDSSKVKQQNALGLLKAYSFITGQADGQTVSLHRLVHIATRNWLRNREMLEQWTVNTGKRLRDIFPSNKHKNRILWREYLPHALFILQSEEFQNDKQDREDLVQRVAQCLFKDGRYDQAGALFKEVLENKSKRLKNGDKEMLGSMAWMASTYEKQGRWTEAEKLKTVLRPEHPDTLTSMNDLAVTYLNLGRWTEAEKLKTVLGPEHPSTLISIDNLALTYGDQGRWAEAEKLQVQVLETLKTVLGPEHPDTLTSMHNLALTHHNQGQWAEAEKLQVQVLETRKTVLEPEHPDILTSMWSLSYTLKKLPCVQLQNQRLGPSHPDTVAYGTPLSKILPSKDQLLPADRRRVIAAQMHIQSNLHCP
ncbi:hypothetical protein V8E54_003008 [Elaphomyces granulatus]